MKRLEVTYSIVTPMYLGDANQASTSFRIPSLKGALRFWWRALAWKEAASQGSSPASALRALHAREAALFGSAAGRDSGTQSKVLLSLKSPKANGTPNKAERRIPFQHGGLGVTYLKGQGLSGRHPLSTTSVSIVVNFHPRTGVPERKSVEKALFLLGLLGGLGSRARHGFGSTVLTSMTGDRSLTVAIPRDRLRLGLALKQLIEERPNACPPFSAFSSDSRVDLSFLGNSPHDVLGSLGDKKREYRKTSLEGDNKRARAVANGNDLDGPIERSIFGLPVQFYFKEDAAKVFVAPKISKIDRRATPLLTHIHYLPDEPPETRYAAVQTHLPAQFLPTNAQVGVKGRGNSRSFPSKVLSQTVITTFLDSFDQREALIS